MRVNLNSLTLTLANDKIITIFLKSQLLTYLASFSSAIFIRTVYGHFWKCFNLLCCKDLGEKTDITPTVCLYSHVT